MAILHGTIVDAGSIYVADSGNHRIRKFRLSHSSTTRSRGNE